MSDHHAEINDFDIIIASLPTKENCVCEIYYKDNQWVEISLESDQLMIQFYCNSLTGYWEFPLEVVLDVLQKAKKAFIGN